jgi:hypothetical protein
VKKGPRTESVAREAIVVLVRQILFHPYGDCIVVLLKFVADALQVFLWNHESWLAKPLEIHLFFQRTKTRVEAARRHLIVTLPLSGTVDCDHSLHGF